MPCNPIIVYRAMDRHGWITRPRTKYCPLDPGATRVGQGPLSGASWGRAGGAPVLLWSLLAAYLAGTTLTFRASALFVVCLDRSVDERSASALRARRWRGRPQPQTPDFAFLPRSEGTPWGSPGHHTVTLHLHSRLLPRHTSLSQNSQF